MKRVTPGWGYFWPQGHSISVGLPDDGKHKLLMRYKVFIKLLQKELLGRKADI